jgi:hypothetical protein
MTHVMIDNEGLCYKKEDELNRLRIGGSSWTINLDEVDIVDVKEFVYSTDQAVYRISRARALEYGFKAMFKGETKLVVPVRYWDIQRIKKDEPKQEDKVKDIVELLQEIQDEHVRKCADKILDYVAKEYVSKPSSIGHHHFYKGGMGKHIKEVMNIALELYDLHPDWYECTRDDVILVGFVHDLDKLDKYIDSEDWMKQEKYGSKMFMYAPDKMKLGKAAETVMVCAQHGLVLTPMQVNAISYHHGGWSEEKIGVQHMTPLCLLMHCADLMSSKIFEKGSNA